VIIINDDQQDATILDLFISSVLYMFRAIPSPIIRNAQLYLQFPPILLLVGVIHDTSQQQYWLPIPEAVSTVTRS
jgi:hypothetical protein